MVSNYVDGRRVIAIGHSAGASAMWVLLAHHNLSTSAQIHRTEFFSMYSTKHLGHSLSSSTLHPTMSATSAFNSMSARYTPYKAIILVEPALIDRQTYNAHFEDRESQINQVMESVNKSRATWDSREDALTWLTRRYPWKAWDSEVVELFVVSTDISNCILPVSAGLITDHQEHGLRETRNAAGDTHITVKCSKAHEAQNVQ